MSCNSSKRLCNNLIISTGVSFANNNLVIALPEGSYINRRNYCIVVAQNIPDTTQINSPVVFTIGADTTTTYPLLNPDCTTVYACSINKRTRYSVCVYTDVNNGVFKLKCRIPCSRCNNSAPSLPIPTTTTPAS